MKALSLWQPWASLMAAGLKTIETRSWPTRYRGPLAIHAVKRPLTVGEHELIHRWIGMKLLSLDWLTMRLPFGAIVAVVQLVRCEPAGTFRVDLLNEAFGNFASGRWAWITQGVRLLAQPIPYRGMQGLFDIPDLSVSLVNAEAGHAG